MIPPATGCGTMLWGSYELFPLFFFVSHLRQGFGGQTWCLACPQKL